MLNVHIQMDRHDDTSECSDNSYQCRYCHEPFENCYCSNINGKSIPKVVQYCMNDYRMCPVYRERVLKKGG